MDNLTDLFKYITKVNFIGDFTDINPKNGIQNRLIGKGTNAKDKRTKPSEEEMAKIKAGLNLFLTKAQKVVNEL